MNHEVLRTATEPATPPEFRHVLIIEPSGFAYVAPHLPDRCPPERCVAVKRAWAAFLLPSDVGTAVETMTPGRYWFDVLDDGNAWIGGRVDR